MSNKMDEEQLDLLGELLDGFPSEPAEDAPEVEEPKADDINIEEPADVPEPEVEKEDKDAAEDTTAILREQILKLTEQLNKDPMMQQVAEEPQKVVEETQETKQKQKQTLEAFLTEDEVDRIIDEPQLLNVAFSRAISVMQQNMQSVIQSEVSKQVMVSKAVSDFYVRNQDLAPYNKFVQFVMSEIERENPDKTYADIFEMTANDVRKRLGLPGQVQGQFVQTDRGQSPAAKQKPAFAGSKRNSPRPSGKIEWFDPNAADLFGLQ